jgi:hypothetical protein
MKKTALLALVIAAVGVPAASAGGWTNGWVTTKVAIQTQAMKKWGPQHSGGILWYPTKYPIVDAKCAGLPAVGVTKKFKSDPFVNYYSVFQCFSRNNPKFANTWSFAKKCPYVAYRVLVMGGADDAIRMTTPVCYQ